jgi:hypothetical protein
VAKTVTSTQTVTLSGDGWGGSPLFNESIQNISGNPPSSWQLSTGFNQFPVPATALGVVIVPPTGNAVSLTLKGANPDTGTPIAPASSHRITWTAGQVSLLGMAVGSNVTLYLIWL